MKNVFHHEGTLFFDPEDRIYLDHFPGNPVVPGSVIIHAFLQVHGEFAQSESPVKAENFRFKYFVSPGEYHFEMTKKDKVIKCRLLKEKRLLATGDLVL